MYYSFREGQLITSCLIRNSETVLAYFWCCVCLFFCLQFDKINDTWVTPMWHENVEHGCCSCVVTVTNACLSESHHCGSQIVLHQCVKN